MLQLIAALVLVHLCLFFGAAAGAVAEDARDRPDEPLVSGISSYQVFPRIGDVGSIPFRPHRSGLLVGRVIRNEDGKDLVQQSWNVQLGAQSETKQLEFASVPVGGEYTLRFEMDGRPSSFEHVLVGEIWVAGGQSNALGAPGEPFDPIPQVHLFRDGWQEGRDPLFPWFGNQVHIAPWIQAAREYHRLTGIPVGLMGYCAPAKEIDFFMDFGHLEMQQFKPLVERHGRGASVFMWYQGEGDCSTERRLVYKDRLASMANALRRYAGNDEMKVVVVQLSYVINFFGEPTDQWGKMRDVQKRFCEEDANAILVPALPYPHKDAIHLDADGARGLGDRIGQALAEANDAGRVLWQGPRAVEARFADATRRRVNIRFDSARKIVLAGMDGEKRETADGQPPEESAKRDPAEDWFITDDSHLGDPEILASEIRDGALVVEIEGARMKLPEESNDASGQSASIGLSNTGYIQPESVAVQGLTLVLNLPEAAGPSAKVSYARMSNSHGSLADESGKPAAAFIDMNIDE